MWFFLYYGWLPRHKDPKYWPYHFPQIVLVKKLESQVVFIRELLYKLGIGLLIIWIISFVILNLIFG